MKMTSIPFTEDLKDKSSEAFRSLSFKVSRQIFVYLSTTSLGSSLLSVTILNFRQGSVVANYNANFKSNATVSDSGVSGALQQAISSDPNNTFGIDVSSLCTKSNEDLACGETAGVDQNLIIGLAVCVPILAIILFIILGFIIKRILDRRDEYDVQDIVKKNVGKMASKDGGNAKGIEVKDGKMERWAEARKAASYPPRILIGRAPRTVPVASYAMQPASFERLRGSNYKRMRFQPSVQTGPPASKYEEDRRRNQRSIP
ncbi:uncharacterized protein [Branchiostoma lanceolatum]|uniref:uncharacterized protein isoform X1 n=1 Tax=Branchiostoma lanceolatum TaxID=7740 RepID=UPI0034535375